MPRDMSSLALVPVNRAGATRNREGSHMTESDGPTVVPVETFAHGLTDKQLSCRELGHTWVQWDVQVIRESRRVGGYERTMRCRQCRTERRQLLDSFGSVVRNGYRYADGYLAANVQKGFTRDTFRLESVTRWLERHEDKEERSA